MTSRTASLAITALLVILITNYDQWVSLVIGFGFAHYLLSFYYAASRVRITLSNPVLALPLASLGTLFAVIYFLDFPLEIYFGIHHACNEGYLRYASPKGSCQQNGQLSAARALFHLAVYFIVLRQDPMVSQLPETFLWLLLFAASVIYIFQLRAAKSAQRVGLNDLIKGSGVELMLLALVGLSFFFRITFLQVVMYHFVLWTIVPIPAIKSRGQYRLAEYSLLTAGSLLLFLSVTMTQLFSSFMSLSFLYTQFIFWSYIHITTSFALSVAHPQWIVNLFRNKQVY